MRGPLRVLSALVCTAVVLVGCGGSHRQRSPSEVARLRDRVFAATAVQADPAPPFAGPGGIHVTFLKRGEPTIGWEADCNSYVAALRITPETLRVSKAAGTSIRCEALPGRQDKWLSRFFESDPAWALDGVEVILSSSEGRVLRLRESLRLTSSIEAERHDVRRTAVRWLKKMSSGDIRAACRLMDAGSHASHPEYPQWGPARNCEERWLHSDNTPLSWKPSPTAVSIWGDSDPEVVAVDLEGDSATVSVSGIGVRRPVWLRRERGHWLVDGAEYPI